jgi:hypothetical protein
MPKKLTSAQRTRKQQRNKYRRLTRKQQKQPRSPPRSPSRSPLPPYSKNPYPPQSAYNLLYTLPAK